MKKIGKKIFFGILALLVSIFIIGAILAFLPTKSKTNHIGISPEKAASLRQNFVGPHQQFTTSDGETLFLRRWNPDSIEPAKKAIAVLIFHGITAHSGPYDMAGKPLRQAAIRHLGWITEDTACRVGTEGITQVKNDGLLI